MSIAWRVTSWSTEVRGGVLDPEKSSTHTKSSGGVAWAFGARLSKGHGSRGSPRQCVCAGSTPTRVMRVDKTTDLKGGREEVEGREEGIERGMRDER